MILHRVSPLNLSTVEQEIVDNYRKIGELEMKINETTFVES
jgi:hypothetical protein